MYFTLRSSGDDATIIEHQFSCNSLADLLEHVETFIKASGFSYTGELNIFESDNPNDTMGLADKMRCYPNGED